MSKTWTPDALGEVRTKDLGKNGFTERRAESVPKGLPAAEGKPTHAKTVGAILIFAGIILFLVTAGYQKVRTAEMVATAITVDLINGPSAPLSLELEKPRAFDSLELETVRSVALEIRKAKAAFFTHQDLQTAKELDSRMFAARTFYVKRAEREMSYLLLPFFIFSGMALGLGAFFLDEGRFYGDNKRHRPVILCFGSIIAAIAAGAWIL